MSANSIKVVARFRPQNRVELESGGKPIVSFNLEDSCSLDVRLSPGRGPVGPQCICTANLAL